MISMRRRGFLHGILALGLLPDVLEAAGTTDEDLVLRAHQQLGREPMRFAVDDVGTLRLANYLPSADRFTAYDISPEDLEFQGGRYDLLDRIEALRYEIYWYSQDLRGEEGGLQDWETDMVDDFLDTLSADELDALQTRLRAWFAEEVSLEERDGMDIVRPVDGRDWAYELFRTHVDIDLLEAFDIVVVEGEHPGSTYYAAELRSPVEEANRIAGRLDLPIIFERASD